MANITKVFVVLTAVFALVSIALSVLVVAEFVYFQNQQAPYRLAVQAANARSMGAVAVTAQLEGERNNYRDALERLRTVTREKDVAYEQQIRNAQNQIADLERQIATGSGDLNRTR